MQQLKIPNKETSLSFFYISSCSLNISFAELRILLQSTNIQSDVMAITESQITKNISVNQNIELSNYSFEHTPTESSARVMLLYVANHLSYKAPNLLPKMEATKFINILKN